MSGGGDGRLHHQADPGRAVLAVVEGRGSTTDGPEPAKRREAHLGVAEGIFDLDEALARAGASGSC